MNKELNKLKGDLNKLSASYTFYVSDKTYACIKHIKKLINKIERSR